MARKKIGAAALVSAAFIGPGTVTSATIAGAKYGYTLLWAVLFSLIATFVLQEMAARLGWVKGMGVGQAIREKLAGRPAFMIVASLVIGAIFIGNSAYEAGNITGAVLGFGVLAGDSYIVKSGLVLGVSAAAFGLLYTSSYKRIEGFLIGLVGVMGLVFVLAAILVVPSLSGVIQGLFIPQVPPNSLLMVVSLIGTTVVPYNLFLHASGIKHSAQDYHSTREVRQDTLLSIALGGLITACILIAAAGAYQVSRPSAGGLDALSASLRPVLGGWSDLFLAFGFLAAGLSSSITAPLASAFAISEVLGWKDGIKGTGFRLVWGIVLSVGVTFALLDFKPIRLIVFAQVMNGLLLPVIASLLIWIMNDTKLMGHESNGWLSNAIGVFVILITLMLGAKSVLAAFGV